MSKLHQALTDLGLDVAMGTLKAYSVRYKWQERSALIDGAKEAIELANVPREMDERQAWLGNCHAGTREGEARGHRPVPP